ncbi:WxL domain-containing protein [Enterococcus sp. LJL120]
MKKAAISLICSGIILSVGSFLQPDSALASSLSNDGSITFEGEYPWSIVDPENPGTIVDPGESETVGDLLRIEYVPDLRFGTQTISQQEATYQAFAQNFYSETPARGNFVQIADYRNNTGSGWTLSLKQENQFHSSQDASIELLGATLFFDKSWSSSPSSSAPPTIQTDIIEVNPGNSYIVANAEAGTGIGKWTISFGNSQNLQPTQLTDELYNNQAVYLNPAVGLKVPHTANVKALNYTTVLTWTLSELPQ